MYRVGSQPGGPLYVPEAPNNKEGPQARESSKCLNRQSYGERLAKEAFWSPAQEAQKKKDSDRAINSAVEAVCDPAHLAPPGSLQVKQLRHLPVQVSLGQRCYRQKKKKKVLHLCMHGHFSCIQHRVLQPWRLWPVRLLCQRVFPRQEYCSTLVNTDWHALLEHYISCCPRCQLPWVPGAARIPETQ